LPGKHFVIAVRYGSSSSPSPASAIHFRITTPDRPLNGKPVWSSTLPGACPTIAIASLAFPATIGRARSSHPAATHFVHARMRP